MAADDPRRKATFPDLMHSAGGVARDVRTVLVDDADDAERHPHLVDVQAVGTGPALDDLTDRIRQRGDVAQAGRHRRDPPARRAAAGRRPSPWCPAALGALDVDGVGGEHVGDPLLEQVGGREEAGVLGRRRRQSRADGWRPWPGVRGLRGWVPWSPPPQSTGAAEAPGRSPRGRDSGAGRRRVRIGRAPGRRPLDRLRGRSHGGRSRRPSVARSTTAGGVGRGDRPAGGAQRLRVVERGRGRRHARRARPHRRHVEVGPPHGLQRGCPLRGRDGRAPRGDGCRTARCTSRRRRSSGCWRTTASSCSRSRPRRRRRPRRIATALGARAAPAEQADSSTGSSSELRPLV